MSYASYFDLFLIKKIVSREWELHFRRWQIVETPLFSIYVHCISKSDEERDPHDHPWWFASLVLKGGYRERVWTSDGRVTNHERLPGALVVHGTQDFHKLTLLGDSAWTLVLTGSRTNEPWGYKTEAGWVDFVTYRKRKHPT